MKYTFLLCLLPLAMFAQRKDELSAFSLEYGLGTISSFSGQLYYLDCGFGRCLFDDEVFIPTATKYASILFNYHLKERHKLGVGISLSEHGFLRKTNVFASGEIYTDKVIQKYKCVKIRHLFKILRGESISFSIGNSFDLEFLDKSHSITLTRNTFSHLLEANVGISIKPDFEMFIGMLYRTEIVQSLSTSDSGSFTRFGMGAMIGLAHRF